MRRSGSIVVFLALCLALSAASKAEAGTAPGYQYYDYSRADWGANPAYDNRNNLYAPANVAPYTVVSPDLDSGTVYYPTIKPGQLIFTPDTPQIPTGIAIHDTADAGSNYSCDLSSVAPTLRGIQRYHATQDYGHIPYGVGNPDPRREVDNGGVPDSTLGDIAYQFLIDCGGHVYEGRAGGIFRMGEHVHRHNQGQIGIALLGDFTYQQPSPAQRAALVRLVTRLCRDLNINPMAVWHQPLLDGTTETLSKNGKAVLNVAGHIDFPNNDHTDPGVLDLNAVRQDVVTGLQNGNTETFAETSQTLAEPFRAYWEANGGLPIFGFPIGPLHNEPSPNDGKIYPVQYFERARFELHADLVGTPYYILLGRLGVDAAQAARLRNPAPFNSHGPLAPGDTGYYFAETGHSLHNGFRDYWIANGGLAIFGLPLSEEFAEADGQGHTYTVQYFERARFEYHPEAPPQYKVLLGRLGVAASIPQ